MMLYFIGMFLCLVGITSGISIVTTGVSSTCFLKEKSKQYKEVHYLYSRVDNNLALALDKEFHEKHYKGDVDKYIDDNELMKQLNNIVFEYDLKISTPNTVMYYSKNVEWLTKLTNETKQKIINIDNLVKQGKLH